MPNTTNFNWPTPADTDLVKDGAAAIRNLGNGIDTSLIDLKGGTTGQILSKASNADMDFTFITPNVGDITEVQAGTGISVASGTGPIPVITNTVATAFDAAGDLVYGTGADTFTKLSLGTAGQVLKVNSGATAPEWGAAAAPALTLISSTTFASSSSHSVNDVFSSTYDNYLIMPYIDSISAGAYINMRLRVSGSDNTSSNYYWSQFFNTSSNQAYQSDYSNGLATSWAVLYQESTGAETGVQLFLYNPQQTKRTSYSAVTQMVRSGDTVNQKVGGATSVTTSYTGFTLFPATGNMTGGVRVYGYSNS